MLGAELWTDQWEVLQSPRAIAVGIPAWCGPCAQISTSLLPLPSCLPLGLQETCGDHSSCASLTWHQQQLGQAGDTQLEVLFLCLEQGGPSQGQSGPAGQQM